MAGKARKAREHKNKMAAKRQSKQNKRALYASLAGTSKKNKKTNKKKHGEARFDTFTPGKHQHLMKICGNTGCTCNKTVAQIFINKVLIEQGKELQPMENK